VSVYDVLTVVVGVETDIKDKAVERRKGENSGEKEA